MNFAGEDYAAQIPKGSGAVLGNEHPNPFDLAVVFVHDAQKRFLGTARRTDHAEMADPEQIKLAFGKTEALRFDRAQNLSSL